MVFVFFNTYNNMSYKWSQKYQIYQWEALNLDDIQVVELWR